MNPLTNTTAPNTICLVEDDPVISDLVQSFLHKEGFNVQVASNATELDDILMVMAPDLIVLDLMLPGEDGLSICRRLRATRDTPILILTARGDEIDRIIGLEMGADDYLTKPFNPRELLARIRSILRRTHLTKPDREHPLIHFGEWIMDPNARELKKVNGEMIDLTGIDFDLLTVFVSNPRRVLSRDQLLDATRGRMSSPLDRAIDVQISRLRRLIGDNPRKPQVIKTIRNKGYIFTLTVRG